jgi:hypothetical protein
MVIGVAGFGGHDGAIMQVAINRSLLQVILEFEILSHDVVLQPVSQEQQKFIQIPIFLIQAHTLNETFL